MKSKAGQRIVGSGRSRKGQRSAEWEDKVVYLCLEERRLLKVVGSYPNLAFNFFGCVMREVKVIIIILIIIILLLLLLIIFIIIIIIIMIIIIFLL